jgi:hypothetical protein
VIPHHSPLAFESRAQLPVLLRRRRIPGQVLGDYRFGISAPCPMGAYRSMAAWNTPAIGMPFEPLRSRRGRIRSRSLVLNHPPVSQSRAWFLAEVSSQAR